MTYPPGPPSMPYPSMPFGAVPPPAPRNRRALTVVLGAIVVVLALILAGGIVFVVKARNGDIYVPGLTLRAANDPGDDPFTDPVLTSGASTIPANVALSSQVGAPTMGGRAVNGTEPGLYAVGDSAACDTVALGNRLQADPAAARAWASVFGISTAAIPHYLNTLTPVILTADTWVTNHTFTSGRANPFQAVLQRGTAVYVDAAGVPRAVCSCGNPLAPPAAAPIGGYRLEGRPWDGYGSRTVTRVAYSNQNVTTVDNTTTIVPGTPTPAAGTPGVAPLLQLLSVVTGQIVNQAVGGLLDLSGTPPLAEPLPSPAALNAPFVADDAADAERNGLDGPGDPAPAPAVTERAAADGDVPSGEPGSDTPTDSPTGTPTTASDATPAPSGSGSVPGAGDPSTEAASSESASPESASPEIPAAESSTPPRPTSFSGSGDQIGSLTFDDDARSVSCTVPTTTTSGPADLSCSDGTSRSIGVSALQRASVTAATDAAGVWTVTFVTATGTQTVPVVSATWTVAPPSTTETSATETYSAPPAVEPAETSTETATPIPDAPEDPTTTTETVVPSS